MSSEQLAATLPDSGRSPRRVAAIASSSDLQKQVLRFLLIGGTSVAIDLAAYYWLSQSMASSIAKTISYVLGMLFGFVGNKFWTFESQRKSLSEPIVYALLYAVTLAVNVGVNWSAFELFEWIGAETRFSKFMAFLIATGLTTILNFVGMKFVAFRGEQEVACENH